MTHTHIPTYQDRTILADLGALRPAGAPTASCGCAKRPSRCVIYSLSNESIGQKKSRLYTRSSSREVRIRVPSFL